VRRRLLRGIASIAALLGACAACGSGSDGEPPVAASDVSPTSVDAAAPTTTTTTTTTTSMVPDDRLLVALSVHVERYEGETEDEALFDAHVAQLLALADRAEAYGAVVSFELSSEFVTAATTWHSTVVADLAARGHGIGQHSGDRTVAGLEGEARVSALAGQRAAIAALGVDVNYVSGACSDGAWVEAVAAAGFVGTSGVTEYCLRALDDAHLPDGMDWIRQCTNPGVCHDPLHLDTGHLAHPWTASTSTAFLTDDPLGAVVVVPTVESLGLATMSQGQPVDLEAALADWRALLDAHVAQRSTGRVSTLDVTVSIGPDPDVAVLDAMLAELAARGVTTVRSATMAEIVELAAAEAAAQPADPAPSYVDTAPDLGGRPPGSSTLPSRPPAG
jgi:hypothetical protein